jgi:PIN domain nuclease of toxin-antitoxin system
VKVLLDTHVWLWMLAFPERLGSRAIDLVRSDSDELILSAVSSWEIAVKWALGKLDLPQPPEIYVPDRMQAEGIGSLAVDHGHALHVASLPQHHGDPFDRLLIAQSQVERIPIVTADRRFELYDVEVVWADG